MLFLVDPLRVFKLIFERRVLVWMIEEKVWVIPLLCRSVRFERIWILFHFLLSLLYNDEMKRRVDPSRTFQF